MPRTFTVEKTVYKLQELEGKGRENALDWLRERATQFDWWEFSFDQFKEVGEILGIEIKDIYFSGFWSQGDGACFVGSYYYKKGAAKALKVEWPADTELHRIADKLQAIQRRNFYRLNAVITKGGRYAHEHSVEIETEMDGMFAAVQSDEGNRGELAEVLRDFMRWIYRSLEQEYNYLTSEEQLIEMADANGYEFTSNGSIA